MTDKSTLTAERLRELLDYDPESGVFRRRISLSNGIQAGDLAGGMSAIGYHRIAIDGYRHWTHRLVWLYAYGEWPDGQVDHRNQNRADNRLANLRLATSAENRQNDDGLPRHNTSGIRGVHRHQGRWRARVQIDGRSVHVGCFDTIEEASAAYLAAKAELHPFWANR